MRIGEPPAAKIRHRVRLAPDHIVQDPEAQVLQDGADAKNVVVGADHPKRAVLAEQPPALRQPVAGERVIGGKIVKTVPVVVHAIDKAVIRAPQFAPQLQVVRRIGEHAVHRRGRQHAHHLHTIAPQNLVQRQLESEVQDLFPTLSTPLPHRDGRFIVTGRPKSGQSAIVSSNRSCATVPNFSRWWRVGPSRCSASRCSAVA